MSDERPVWKTVLSISVSLFLVIRLVYTCSKMSDPQPAYPQNVYQDLQNNQAVQNYQQALRETSAAQSNQLLYLTYDALDSLPLNIKKLNAVTKLRNDTLVNLDISTKIKVKKESFFQKNYDDSLKLAFKTPENLTVFIHDFESKQDCETNFKSLKRGLHLSALQYDQGTTKAKLFAYSLTHNNVKFNGYCIGIQSDNYCLFLEFESDKIAKATLKETALTYMLSVLHSPK
jgi:hypothetical protein